MISLGFSALICFSDNRLNYYLSSSLSPSFSGGLTIRIALSSSSTRVVVPQVIRSIKVLTKDLTKALSSLYRELCAKV